MDDDHHVATAPAVATVNGSMETTKTAALAAAATHPTLNGDAHAANETKPPPTILRTKESNNAPAPALSAGAPTAPAVAAPPPKSPPPPPPAAASPRASKRPSPMRDATSPLRTSLQPKSPRSKAAPAAAAAPAPACKPHYRRLYRDAIAIRLDLASNVDLGQALQQARAKRVAALQRAFPDLVKATSSKRAPSPTTQAMEEDDETSHKGGTKSDEEDSRPKQKKATGNAPRPSEYANMIEYLEAKYVQGVMLDDNQVDEDDEGAGSVYSETSFMDDTDLQRTIAEQVLASSTTTKMELEHDDEFFVNVGSLEVEESDLTQAHYDPLQDGDKKKATKKRKPSVKKTGDQKDAKSTGTAASGGAKKKAKTVKDENAKPNKESTTATAGDPEGEQSVEVLREQADAAKARVDDLYQTMVDMIESASAEELPRKKTKDRVSVICPADKVPGDSITFSNPHVPGQRLKVTVPKNTPPGGTFKVTVPVADTSADDDTDHNKLSRAFYDTLDDYARAYDDWCDAEACARRLDGDKDFTAHLEKRKKYDGLIEEFPSDLKTPVDAAYMKKLLRRARQNRSKREQTAARHLQTHVPEKVASSPSKSKAAAATTKPAAKAADPATAAAAGAKTISIPLPALSKNFAVQTFDRSDFS